MLTSDSSAEESGARWITRNGRQPFKFDIFSGFLFELSELEELPLEFAAKLFQSLVDYATVYHGGRIVFRFRNGTEIETII